MGVTLFRIAEQACPRRGDIRTKTQEVSEQAQAISKRVRGEGPGGWGAKPELEYT